MGILAWCLVMETRPDEAYMNQWYSTLSDPGKECPVDGLMETAEKPLFEVANDCKELDARWDYNFKGKVKPKRGYKGAFEGKGFIELARYVS